MDYQAYLNDLIETVIREGGSDLHISAGRYPSLRVAGELIFLVKRDIITDEAAEKLLKLMIGEEKWNRFKELLEIDFAYDFRGEARLRGSAYIHKGKLAVALRLIPKVRSMSELHLPKTLESFAEKRQGFFLIVGPVGQGKSTTLAAMIEHINQTRAEHIITIEDPIEYVFESKHSVIDQREVGIDTHDFNNALRNAFREDVDVIMIGEMRSPETIATAVTAAETGHLVFSTVHTNTASQTIDRIISSFPGEQQDQIRMQLASSLLGIFSQRLIPKITGGLVPAFELLINNAAVSNLIREKRTHEIDIIIETGHDQGMVDMNRSLLELVRAGEISMDNALAYSFNQKALERLI